MKRPLIVALFLMLGIRAAEASGAAPESITVESGNGVAAPAAEPSDSRWQLGVALGYGVRTNPLQLSDDIPIVVDIDIAWFGDRFFFDNGDLGFTFANNDFITASVVGRINSDRVFFGRTDTKFVTVGLSGMPLADAVELTIPDRDYAAELGLELLADGGWGQLQMTAHHDVSGTHGGYEIDFDYSYGWRDQRWYIEPSVGLSFKSDALNDYYWGVRPDEANDALPVYRAESGINAQARLLFSYQLTRNWNFAAVAEYERLNDEAASSPLVRDSDVFGYFAGFGYRFGR